MKLKNTMVLTVLLVSLVLTGCESKDKSTTKVTQRESMLKRASNIANETTKVYLEGTLSGKKDGKAFSETFHKNKPAASLQTRGGAVSLHIESQKTAIMLIGQSVGVGNYHGVGHYDAKDLNFIKMQIDTKTMGVEQVEISEKKVEITEDSATDIKGTVSFITTSQSGETHSIEGAFAFKKIIISPDDKQALLELIKLNKDYIGSASVELRKDHIFMQKASLIHAFCFRFAGTSLKKDKAFVLSVVKEKPAAILMSLDESLVDDKDFAIEMVKANKKVIHFLPSNLKKDKDVIEASKN